MAWSDAARKAAAEARRRRAKVQATFSVVSMRRILKVKNLRTQMGSKAMSSEPAALLAGGGRKGRGYFANRPLGRQWSGERSAERMARLYGASFTAKKGV